MKFVRRRAYAETAMIWRVRGAFGGSVDRIPVHCSGYAVVLHSVVIAGKAGVEIRGLALLLPWPMLLAGEGREALQAPS